MYKDNLQMRRDEKKIQWKNISCWAEIRKQLESNL